MISGISDRGCTRLSPWRRTPNDLQLAGSGEAIRLSGFSVTAGFFHVLGLTPAMGREFDRDDERPGRGEVAIISDRLWRTRFGARKDALGKKIYSMVPYTVVGVMPPGVEHPGNRYHAVAYGDTVDMWTPFTAFGDPSQRGSHYMEVIGRLRSGISAGQAQGEMNAAMAQPRGSIRMATPGGRCLSFLSKQRLWDAVSDCSGCCSAQWRWCCCWPA